MRTVRALVLRTFCGRWEFRLEEGSWAADYSILIRTEACLQSACLSRGGWDGISQGPAGAAQLRSVSGSGSFCDEAASPSPGAQKLGSPGALLRAGTGQSGAVQMV